MKVTGAQVRRALVAAGLPVIKVERVSFTDLARGEAFFATLGPEARCKDVADAAATIARAVGERLGVRVIPEL